jgi:hypothetical protein
MAIHSREYDEVAKPHEGGTTPSGKDSSNCDDALGNPGRMKKQTEFTATPQPDSKVKAARDKQLGTNIDLVWDRSKES